MSAAAPCAPPRTALYRRRQPERTLFYRTVQTHLATWLERSCGTWQGGSAPAHDKRLDTFEKLDGVRDLLRNGS
ncbi:MAG: hypothetical protein HY525_05280 [Betaproteobacteria bacterium]|nr:hypothetical protein [Betaproteobacteria bacterium]